MRHTSFPDFVGLKFSPLLLEMEQLVPKTDAIDILDTECTHFALKYGLN